jgi:hypothetical protein
LTARSFKCGRERSARRISVNARQRRSYRAIEPVLKKLDAPRISGGVRRGAEILTADLQDHDPSVLIDYGRIRQELTDAGVYQRGVGVFADRAR